MLEDLLLDDLKRKYAGKRVEKCINNEEEQLAIAWFRNKLSLDPGQPGRVTDIFNCGKENSLSNNSAGSQGLAAARGG